MLVDFGRWTASDREPFPTKCGVVLCPKENKEKENLFVSTENFSNDLLLKGGVDSLYIYKFLYFISLWCSCCVY